MQRQMISGSVRRKNIEAALSSILPQTVFALESTSDLPLADLFPEEAALIGAFAERRRREFATTRCLARRALASLGVPPVAVLPGVGRAPVWPGGVVGSITHCDGYRAVAVASARVIAAIGIDAEHHATLPDGVLERVSLENERKWIGHQSDGVCWDRVLFSAKESVFKAWFPLTQQWIGFESVAIGFEPATTGFHAHFLVDPPMVDGATVPAFTGRYAVVDGRVLTSVVVERSSQRGC
jgi:4'-phosphopantetheinyl transferase EntD